MANFSVTPYSKSVQVMPSMVVPMANSTPMQTDMSTHNTSYTYNTINYNSVTINLTLESPKSRTPSKQVACKKSITPHRTTTNAIKSARNNKNNKNSGYKTVQRILCQINMTKYAHLFKNYDLDRFKQMSELGLNAMGITRPQEIRTFKDAISKAKYGKY